MKEILDNKKLTEGQKISKLEKMGYSLEEIFEYVLVNY